MLRNPKAQIEIPQFFGSGAERGEQAQHQNGSAARFQQKQEESAAGEDVSRGLGFKAERAGALPVFGQPCTFVVS